jgi:hypothetical protein
MAREQKVKKKVLFTIQDHLLCEWQKRLGIPNNTFQSHVWTFITEIPHKLNIKTMLIRLHCHDTKVYLELGFHSCKRIQHTPAFKRNSFESRRELLIMWKTYFSSHIPQMYRRNRSHYGSKQKNNRHFLFHKRLVTYFQHSAALEHTHTHNVKRNHSTWEMWERGNSAATHVKTKETRAADATCTLHSYQLTNVSCTHNSSFQHHDFPLRGVRRRRRRRTSRSATYYPFWKHRHQQT